MACRDSIKTVCGIFTMPQVIHDDNAIYKVCQKEETNVIKSTVFWMKEKCYRGFYRPLKGLFWMKVNCYRGFHGALKG